MSAYAFPDDRLSRILTAVETIEESLGILARKGDVSLETYENDSDTRDVVERRFVKMTEAAIDIGEAFLVHERGRHAESNAGTMRALADLDILTDELAEEMAQVARFRNVLAHTYGDVIDHGVVYDALQDLERYRAFVRAIRDHLDSIGALDV